MLLKTKSFGEIEISEDKFITFKEGIPGFEEVKQFIIIEEEKESPFCYLQSIGKEDVCFILTNPYLFKQDYEPVIPTHYFEQLGGGEVDKFGVFVLVTVKGALEGATLNLMAPLLIQQETKCGMQVILEGQNYTTKHGILELLAERGEQTC